METNEAVKQTLVQLAESSVETLMKQLQNVPAGDLPTLEQQLLT